VHTTFWMGSLKGGRPLGRPRCTWEDNIRMDHREIGFWECGLDSFGSGWGQVASSCEHGDEPSGSIKCGEFLD
jgi:hypothetical protein